MNHQAAPTASITIKELVGYALDNSSQGQELVARFGRDFVDSYINMICNSFVSETTVVSYEDYLNKSPAIIEALRSEISAFEYEALKKFKPTIDLMVQEVLSKIV